MTDRTFEDLRCPRCGDLMEGGRCGNKGCDFHWNPMTADESREQDEEA